MECAMMDPEILPKEATITKEECFKYYDTMSLIRRMELECDNVYRKREIRGFLHLYDGQVIE